jgi:hypothetical protein
VYLGLSGSNFALVEGVGGDCAQLVKNTTANTTLNSHFIAIFVIDSRLPLSGYYLPAGYFVKELTLCTLVNRLASHFVGIVQLTY